MGPWLTLARVQRAGQLPAGRCHGPVRQLATRRCARASLDPAADSRGVGGRETKILQDQAASLEPTHG
eukprot:11890687-Alexandrium_andersonii.AAC.1